MTKKLTIAIDFDDTYTADTELWGLFLRKAIANGHSVFCVTCRREDEENRQIIDEAFEDEFLSVPVVFCNMGSKVWTMEQLGIKVDIWIDDAPHALVHGR